MPPVGRGVWQWDLSSGARIMAVGVQADPLKDSTEWWARQQETMPQQEFLREYGIDFGVYGGKPVYPGISGPPRMPRPRRCPTSPTGRSFAGGTCPVPSAWSGSSVSHSAPPVPARAQHDGVARCHILAEFLMDGSVEEAGRQALAMTKEQFPQALEVIDFADPAAFDRRANDSQSAADILRRTCGIHLAPGPRTLTARFEPVRRWLLGAHPYPGAGEPLGKLLIDPNCPRFKEGFKSGITSRRCLEPRPATTTSPRRTGRATS